MSSLVRTMRRAILRDAKKKANETRGREYNRAHHRHKGDKAAKHPDQKMVNVSQLSRADKLTLKRAQKAEIKAQRVKERGDKQ